jgi:hypothetical protein
MTSPGPERRHKIHAPRLKGYLLSWWRDDRFVPSALLPARHITKNGDPLHRPVNSGTYHELLWNFQGVRTPRLPRQRTGCYVPRVRVRTCEKVLRFDRSVRPAIGPAKRRNGAFGASRLLQFLPDDPVCDEPVFRSVAPSDSADSSGSRNRQVLPLKRS